MFGSKKKKVSRFYIKAVENIPTLGKMTIFVDRETGVNYIQSRVGSGNGITPLLDANGEVIVDD